MDLFALARPAIFALDPERAHDLTIAALKRLPLSGGAESDPALAMEVAGLTFPNPVGLAAGFDKNAEVPAQMLRLGFGSVEVGTITPRLQGGNPKPRLFRLAEDRAVINRFGFNNQGLAAAKARLLRKPVKGIVGVNVGANKDSADRIRDYAVGVREMAPIASYLTINISSPNTPGLRALQDKGALAELLSACTAARGAAATPIFLKVAPDLEPADIADIATVAVGQVQALIVSNTTVSRPALRSPHANEAGGLSGAPLAAMSLQRLRDFAAVLDGSLPIVSVGGIASGADVVERVAAGASLVQLYSALVYEGPLIARRISREIRDILRQRGVARLADLRDSARRAGTRG